MRNVIKAEVIIVLAIYFFCVTELRINVDVFLVTSRIPSINDTRGILNVSVNVVSFLNSNGLTLFKEIFLNVFY